MGYLFSPLAGGHHRHYCELYTQAFLSLFEKVVLYSPAENFPYKASPRLVLRALPTNPFQTLFSHGMTYAGSLHYWIHLFLGPKQAAGKNPGPLLILFGDAIRSVWIGRRMARYFVPPVTWALIWNLYAGCGLRANHWQWLFSDRVKKIGFLDETSEERLPQAIRSKAFWFPEVVG